jgi:hypothetical protein
VLVFLQFRDAAGTEKEAAMTNLRDLGQEVPISLGLILVMALALLV